MPLTLSPDHLGLYIHVPFCARKCRYCDFASQPLCNDRQVVGDYLRAIEREATRRRAEITRPLHSIYIGGGTPTMLTPTELTRLWETVVAPFPHLPHAEVTLEANPGTLTEEHIRLITGLPITRVSLGAQSFHPDELRMLGRIHTPHEVEASVVQLRNAGMAQINLDLMYGLPGQTAASWRTTLERALALAPDHLSCYALMLEEDTPLTAEIEAGFLQLPGEEEELAFAAILQAMLDEHGLAPYEVSNAARPGAESRHNLGYWLGRDYLGLGPAAVSTIGRVRWRNVGGVAAYATRELEATPAVEYAERLSAPLRLLERVMLGLRLRDGFDLACAENDSGHTLDAISGEIVVELITAGLLARQGDILRLTTEGYPLANQVVTRLMAMHRAAPVI